jgi:TolB-like protein
VADVFISYAHTTTKQAHGAAGRLRALGYSVWLDDDLAVHRNFTQEIEEQLTAAKAVLVIWSADAVKSEWVLSEANRAREEHKLVQAATYMSRLPMPFDRIQCADLAGWSGEDEPPNWGKITASVAELVGRAGASAPTVMVDDAKEGRLGHLPRWAPAAAVALVMIIVASGAGWWFFGRPAPEPPPLRVAVLPFDVIGQSPQAQAFADGLLDTMVSALAAQQVQAVSRNESRALRGPNAESEIARLGVGLLLDGDVEADGPTLKAHVHLDDARAHTSLWSRHFEGRVDATEPLQTQIASRATAVVRAATWLNVQGFKNKAQVLTEFLEVADDGTAGTDLGRALVLARDVVAQAPNCLLGHVYLAWIILARYPETPADEQAAARAEVVKEAKLALSLDPTSSNQSDDILSAVAPMSDWRERERLLAKSLAVEPNDPTARWLYCMFLNETGRSRDAVVQGQLATSADPLAIRAAGELARALALAGRPEEAAATVAGTERLWGNAPDIVTANVGLVSWSQPTTGVRVMWDDPVVVSAFQSIGWSATLPVFRAVSAAEVSGDPSKKRAAVTALTTDAAQWPFGRGDAVAALSVLDNVDGAIREGDRIFTPAATQEPALVPSIDTRPLFAPFTASLRRDPRFIELAARLGLVDYWKSSGHWPDFCSDPGLPYDCKTEAAKYPAKPAS